MAQRQNELQVYLNTVVQHIELCNSFTIHRFFDPPSHIINYPGNLKQNNILLKIIFLLESALQHVSMFIRSMNNVYQIIEPLFDFGRIFSSLISFIQCLIEGWRYNKSYFIASKTGYPKDERYLLIWVINIPSEIQ